MNQDPLICARCQTMLSPGSGGFWEIRIQAVADPWPPEFTDEDLRQNVRCDVAECIEQLQDVSPREAMEQVHRHSVIHLCNHCFVTWYEDPAG